MKNTIRHTLLALACACTLCCSAQSSAAQIEALAKKGDPTAMYDLANCYAYGQGGVSKDMKKAVKWYERASRHKYAPAQHAMAMCYLDGTGVKKSEARAWEYLSKAAENGDGSAYYQMAMMYRQKHNDRKGIRKYLEYLEKAGENNDPQALLLLAKTYENGDREIGIGQNPMRALGLYQRAADAGNPEAQVYVAGHFAEMDDINRAFDYYQRAARAGEPNAYYSLGLCYYNGDGTPQNYAEALTWLKKADSYNVTDAFTLLGNIYYYGLSVPSDSRTALDYYIKAVRGGDTEAIAELAKIYLDDSSMITDPEMIYHLFDKAATDGSTEGYAGLGVCYEKGIGTTKSPAKAVNYYERAANNGNGFAAYRLYDVYANGLLGEDRSTRKALDYLDRAVNDGYADAIYAKGIECFRGGLMPADPREGIKLLEMAAGQSSAKACAYLGNLYYSGSPVISKDYNKAFTYLEKFLSNPESVDLDTRRKAFRNISACYRFGRGTARNETLADLYTQKAFDTFDIDELLSD